MNFRKPSLQPQFRYTPKIIAIVIEMVSMPAMNDALVKVGDPEGASSPTKSSKRNRAKSGQITCPAKAVD